MPSMLCGIWLRLVIVASNKAISRPRIVLSGFKPTVCDKLTSIIIELGGQVVESVLDSNEKITGATHIVALSSKKENLLIKKRTIKVMQGMLCGLWIVDKKWVTESALKKKWVDELNFELKGDAGLSEISIGGPQRARENMNSGKYLLENTNVALYGEFKAPPRSELLQLLDLAQARIIPIHEALKREDVYIITSDPKNVKDLNKTNFVKQKWLFDSISSYRKQSPQHYSIFS